MINKIFLVRGGLFLAVFASIGLTGCASIVSGTNQVISVEARHSLRDFRPVNGATCQLNNGKGVYYVTTPGTVTVNRAYEDMSIKCEKDNFQPGLASVKSTTKGMAFGNILLGGFIGAGVDAATGAAYDYPSTISVIMGEATLVPPAAVGVTAAK